MDNETETTATANATISAPQVINLECVRISGKLRVRITTPGYLTSANCQFPRDLRVEGRKFQVPPSAITLVTRSSRWFYSVTRKGSITVVDSTPTIEQTRELFEKVKVFEDLSTDECAICLCEQKCMIMVPCGHYYTCETCTKQIKKCPICRANIQQSINKLLMD